MSNGDVELRESTIIQPKEILGLPAPLPTFRKLDQKLHAAIRCSVADNIGTRRDLGEISEQLEAQLFEGPVLRALMGSDPREVDRR
jgi:hypothetical protein